MKERLNSCSRQGKHWVYLHSDDAIHKQRKLGDFVRGAYTWCYKKSLHSRTVWKVSLSGMLSMLSIKLYLEEETWQAHSDGAYSATWSRCLVG